MKSYTDISQSKKLAEILLLESADHFHIIGHLHTDGPRYEVIRSKNEVSDHDGGINALVTRDIEIPYGAKDSELQEVSYYIPECYYAHIDDDKVIIKRRGKSKFNVGDWIISNNKKSTYQVKEVKRGIYVIRDNADNHEYHIGIEEAEKSGRLWTIQDAKDGDILATPDGYPFIFKGFAKFHPDCPSAYCGIDEEKYFSVCSGDGWWTDEKVYPATKEQCDLLFQEMKEAGYEWDVEKKELNKIKYNTQNLWYPADGDYLPEIDREVIALLNNGKIVFAHRPSESWTGRNISTGEKETYYPKRYDKGGWNQPDVKWWLDYYLPQYYD